MSLRWQHVVLQSIIDNNPKTLNNIMCFSTQASIAAAATLSTIGIVSVKRSSTSAQILISCIPILFGIQQTAEGVLWLSVSHTSLQFLSGAATYTFVIIGSLVWPVLIPLSILLLEQNTGKRKWLLILLGTGVLDSAILSYLMINYKVEAELDCFHIKYHFHYPDNAEYLYIFYFIAAVVPTIITSTRGLLAAGVIATLSLIIARLIYAQYLFSVWCFFIAVISVLILRVVTFQNRQNQVGAPTKLS